MSRRVKLVFLIMALLFSAIVTHAQNNDPRPYDEWRLTSLVFIEEQIASRIIEEYPAFTDYSDYAEADVFSGSFEGLSLSPDGETIVAFIWLSSRNQTYPLTHFACIYSIDSQDVVCHLQPENSVPTYPFNVTWSSDSTRLVCHNDPRSNVLDDSDLWLFDLADGSWTNLTDDNYEGSWLYPEGHFWHDIAPIWHPTDDLIYFFRQDSQDASQTGIYEIAADGSSLRKVVDLSTNLTVWSLIQDNRIVAISPNGQFIAIDQYTYPDVMDATIWIADINNDSIRRIEYQDLLAQHNPNEYEGDSIYKMYELSWLDDNETLLLYVSVDSQEADVLLSNFYTLNISSRTLTALRDVTTVTQEERNEAYNQLRQQTVLGAITPDHASIIYNFTGRSALGQSTGTPMAAPLTFDDDPVELNGDPEAVSQFQGNSQPDHMIYRFASNGRLLIDGRLYTLE